MEIEFTQEAINDLEYWKKSGNTKVLKRIRLLLESIKQTPFLGLGKPEPLKHQLAGKWSRRITKADRCIYEVRGNIVYLFSLKGHYE